MTHARRYDIDKKIKTSHQGGIEMNYKIEVVDGNWHLYSSIIDMYVMEGATMEEVKIALAIEMEYAVKLDIVKLLMTFLHRLSTIDDQTIVHQESMDAYEVWYTKSYHRIALLEEYHSLIDEKISEDLIQRHIHLCGNV